MAMQMMTEYPCSVIHILSSMSTKQKQPDSDRLSKILPVEPDKFWTKRDCMLQVLVCQQNCATVTRLLGLQLHVAGFLFNFTLVLKIACFTVEPCRQNECIYTIFVL